MPFVRPLPFVPSASDDCAGSMNLYSSILTVMLLRWRVKATDRCPNDLLCGATPFTN